MLAKDASFDSCLSALVRGMRYILPKQIRGWPSFVNQKDPDPGTTGHVLFMLDLLGLHHIDAGAEAVLFVEESAHRIEGRLLWKSAMESDVFGPRVSLGATILGIAGIVYGMERGLAGRISRKEIAVTIDHCIEQYLEKAQTDPKAGLWEFFMLSDLINRLKILPAGIDTLLDSFHAIWDSQGKKFKKDLTGDCENAAKGLLGLSNYPSSDVGVLESQLLEYIQERKQESDAFVYWDRNPASREATRMGPFFVTRWVAMALAGCIRRGAEIDRTMLDRSVAWLLTEQHQDGSWKEKAEDIVGPGFCVYALLALWEYLRTVHPSRTMEVNQRLNNLCQQLRRKRQICPRRMSPCLEDISHQPNQIFVLMPFQKSFQDVYDSIQEVAKEVDYKAQRADSKFESVDIMCQRICKRIQEARLIIADVSEDNPNVFYEIGLAHGMGQLVWLISRERDSYPFDVSGLQLIIYENLAHLREELRGKLPQLL